MLTGPLLNFLYYVLKIANRCFITMDIYYWMVHDTWS